MGERINRCVELLAQDQAIYYDGPHSGHVLTHAQGRIDAGTWADYMNVGMEHGCVRHGRPCRVHARHGRCRTDTVGAPHADGDRRGAGERHRRRSCAQQRLAVPPDPRPRRARHPAVPGGNAPTRCGPSWNPAAIRTTRSASIPKSHRRWHGWREPRAPRTAAPTPPAASGWASARGGADRKARRRRSGACRPRTTWSAAIPGRSTRKANCCSG